MFNDLRYAFRQLLKNPGFTAVAVLTLALGIGANTAIFSVINAVLLRPLPYRHPEELILISEMTPRDPFSNLVSSADFMDWREQNQVFEKLSAYTSADFILTSGIEPVQVSGERVTADFFQLLGTDALMGRTFLPEEDKPGSNYSVVLSHKLWERQFASDPNILGRAVVLNGTSFVVIGVLRRGFRAIGEWPVELWVPMAFNAEELSERRDRRIRAIARLRPDVSIDRARSDMNIIASRLQQEFPESNSDCNVELVSLTRHPGRVASNARFSLLLLQGAVGFVFLIACTNITSWLLARAVVRQKEIALRAVLGASRWRLTRQMLTESTILAILGGTLGLLFADWMKSLIVPFLPAYIPWLGDVNIDSRVLCFTALILFLTVLIFGLSSARYASKTDLKSALQERSQSSTSGTRHNRILDLLAISQVAITMVLLIGAGLFVGSLLNLRKFHIRQNPQSLLTLQMTLSKQAYIHLPQITSFYDRVLQSIKSVPGVQSVGILDRSPAGVGSRLVRVDSLPSSGLFPEGLGALFGVVDPDYLHALQIPLTTGRYFGEQEARGSSPVVIINETCARRLFPNKSPIGNQLRIKNVVGPAAGDLGNLVYSIVGVVRDVRILPEAGVAMSGNLFPEMYIPYHQSPKFSMPPMHFPSLAIRTAADPMSLVNAVRSAIWAVDKDVPVYQVMTLEQLDAERLAQQRLLMLLMGIFAGIALILAAVGLYGVIAYSVSQRTNEFGVRLALGARASEILWLVLGKGMKLVIVGVALGLAASFALANVIASLLYSVKATDPAIFVFVSLALSAVVLLACYIPARRATRVDPMVALRCE